MATTSTTTELAQTIDTARQQAREIERLTAKHPDLSLADAYKIQDEGINLRLARGERRIGLKMGFTSEAKRKQMGLGSPIYGVLTDRMQVRANSTFALAQKIHPKIEPEIAFVLERDLRGRPTAEQALAACSGVCCAMEILDSRFTGFKYFSLPDVVADNCSAAYFVLGEQVHSPRDIDLSRLKMAMSINGKVAESATSDAISGHPANSLTQLCELLDSRGLYLPAGSIVLAGAPTQAVQLEPGMRVRLEVEKLGAVELNVG